MPRDIVKSSVIVYPSSEFLMFKEARQRCDERGREFFDFSFWSLEGVDGGVGSSDEVGSIGGDDLEKILKVGADVLRSWKMTGRGTERLTQSSSAVSGWAMVTIAGMWDNEVVKEFKYGHIKRGVRLSDSSWWGHCYVDSGGGGKVGVEGRQDWRYIYRKEV